MSSGVATQPALALDPCDPALFAERPEARQPLAWCSRLGVKTWAIPGRGAEWPRSIGLPGDPESGDGRMRAISACAHRS
jgi:hypothetical protein